MWICLTEEHRANFGEKFQSNSDPKQGKSPKWLLNLSAFKIKIFWEKVIPQLLMQTCKTATTSRPNKREIEE